MQAWRRRHYCPARQKSAGGPRQRAPATTEWRHNRECEVEQPHTKGAIIVRAESKQGYERCVDASERPGVEKLWKEARRETTRPTRSQARSQKKGGARGVGAYLAPLARSVRGIPRPPDGRRDGQGARRLLAGGGTRRARALRGPHHHRIRRLQRRRSGAGRQDGCCSRHQADCRGLLRRERGEEGAARDPSPARLQASQRDHAPRAHPTRLAGDI